MRNNAIGSFALNPKSRTTKSNTTKAGSETHSTISGTLGEKLLGDILSASFVGLGVAPFLTVVDKAIVQRAAGTHTIVESSLQTIRYMITNPVAYARSPVFLMMWGVYASTYAAANTIKTLIEHKSHDENRNSQDNTAKTVTFVGTTLVNSTSTVMKDQAYARMFGTAAAAPSVPMKSYTLWAMRDCMVIGSSFVLPDLTSKRLQEQASMSKKDAICISQLTCPILAQFLATPCQLLGLDFYNRPKEPFKGRLLFMGRNYWSVCSARIARIAPAYGIGGIGNTFLRDGWRNCLEYYSEQAQPTSIKLEHLVSNSGSVLPEVTVSNIFK